MLVAARRTGLGQVRAYLAADILRRLSERSKLAPSVIDLLPRHQDDLRAVCAELNIHPPRQTLAPPVGAQALAGVFAGGVRAPVFDVGIRLAGEDAEDAAAGLAGHWIEVADPGQGAAPEGERPLRERIGLGEEPLHVRMMLMTRGYGAAPGDGGDPGGAAKTLARWRELVALWARSPSGAMSRRHAAAVTAAFADGLDTAAALREMAALADDPGEPDGVKFETFAAADMLFGLDLARDIGR